MAHPSTLEPVIKTLLLKDPDQTNFLLVINAQMTLLARRGDEPAVKLMCQFKQLYLDGKLANPESIVRVARKLRERARQEEESINLLPSEERIGELSAGEKIFRDYSLEDKQRDINEQWEW